MHKTLAQKRRVPQRLPQLFNTNRVRIDQHSLKSLSSAGQGAQKNTTQRVTQATPQTTTKAVPLDRSHRSIKPLGDMVIKSTGGLWALRQQFKKARRQLHQQAANERAPRQSLCSTNQYERDTCVPAGGGKIH
jgi:hypothetical protein